MQLTIEVKWVKHTNISDLAGSRAYIMLTKLCFVGIMCVYMSVSVVKLAFVKASFKAFKSF